MAEVDLIVVGARAKAAAIAAKAHVLNSLALGPIMLEIFEATEPAENGRADAEALTDESMRVADQACGTRTTERAVATPPSGHRP
jgi:hypothetical protein